MRRTLSLVTLLVALATGVGYGTSNALGPTETVAPAVERLDTTEQPVETSAGAAVAAAVAAHRAAELAR